MSKKQKQAEYADKAASILRAAIDLLWLQHWEISLHTNTELDGNTEGETYLNTRYMQATIHVQPGLNDETLRRVVVHEAIHVALARMNLALERFHEYVKEEQQELFIEVFTDAEEQTVELLARALDSTIVQRLAPAAVDEVRNAD